MRITYEYQCRVQILFVLLHEFLVVLLGLLPVMLIELGTEILLGQLLDLFPSVRGVNDGGRRDAKLDLPIRLVSAWFPISILPRYPSTMVAAIGDQMVVTLGFP